LINQDFDLPLLPTVSDGQAREIKNFLGLNFTVDFFNGNEFPLFDIFQGNACVDKRSAKQMVKQRQ
jgi:hypothetical protein